MGISFKEVGHQYPGLKKNDIQIALESINLAINEHDEFVAIIGRTGSGKSTLIQHMNGLLLPTSGSISVFDAVITKNKRHNPKLKPIRKRVGFVFQFPEYQLFEETVIKDIMFGPRNFGLNASVAKEKALEAIKLVGIDESILEKSPFNLSGGQMRKVAIAGILAYEPDILILDEPTRGLDPKGAFEIMELFNRINKELHKTIILISHDMDLVYKYATRALVMKDAKLVYDGPTKELFSSDIYLDYHLDKPEVLKLIDYLNNELNLGLSYDIHTEEDFIKSLEARR